LQDLEERIKGFSKRSPAGGGAEKGFYVLAGFYRRKKGVFTCSRIFIGPEKPFWGLAGFETPKKVFSGACGFFLADFLLWADRRKTPQNGHIMVPGTPIGASGGVWGGVDNRRGG
jgi:hypothetical protein